MSSPETQNPNPENLAEQAVQPEALNPIVQSVNRLLKGIVPEEDDAGLVSRRAQFINPRSKSDKIILTQHFHEVSLGKYVPESTAIKIFTKDIGIGSLEEVSVIALTMTENTDGAVTGFDYDTTVSQTEENGLRVPTETQNRLREAGVNDSLAFSAMALEAANTTYEASQVGTDVLLTGEKADDLSQRISEVAPITREIWSHGASIPTPA